MDISFIIDLVIAIIAVAMTVFGYYFSVKEKLRDCCNGAVNLAEDTGMPGEKKLEFAVSYLRSLLPPVAKLLFPGSVVSRLVNTAFESMEEYASKQSRAVPDANSARRASPLPLAPGSGESSRS